MEDYSAHARDYRPSKDDRMTVAQESEWLRSLKAVEEASAERVAESGFFRGVDGHNVAATAQQAVASGDLRLRPGVLEFLNKHTPGSGREVAVGSSVEILSVNWSAHFIRESLVASTEDRDLCARLEQVPIVANEIQGLEDPDGSSGVITGAIQTSADKLVRLDPPNPPGQMSQPPTTVYIGDSPTDFDCLLAAYAGICIRDQPMGSGQRELAETFERMDIPVHHVLEAGRHRLAGVWWARDFKEVETWVCEWQEDNRDSTVDSGSSSSGG